MDVSISFSAKKSSALAKNGVKYFSTQAPSIVFAWFQDEWKDHASADGKSKVD